VKTSVSNMWMLICYWTSYR